MEVMEREQDEEDEDEDEDEDQDQDLKGEEKLESEKSRKL